MSKIVYHGTFSDEPPHEYGGTFHAGTLWAAEDRLRDAEEIGGIATIHGYEISDDAPTSKKGWRDPLSNNRDKRVPEYKRNRIYPYVNEWEDSGSTSYVIPTEFVGKHVKHLGPQFKEPRGEGGKAIMNAVTAMSGGRVE